MSTYQLLHRRPRTHPPHPVEYLVQVGIKKMQQPISLYFAYGSNMNWDQMRERCPSARFEFVAKAEGLRFAFTRFSKKRQCGVADIVASPGSEVWGAVFAIPKS